MKTTLDLPDDLYREVKAKAALDGRRVTDLVIEGLRLALSHPAPPVRQIHFPLIPADSALPPITSQQVAAAENEALNDPAHGLSLRR